MASVIGGRGGTVVVGATVVAGGFVVDVVLGDALVVVDVEELD